MKTQVNLQMTLTKEETIELQAIFVNRADIINVVGIEIDVLWKQYGYSNPAVLTKTMSLTTKQRMNRDSNENTKLIYKWQ